MNGVVKVGGKTYTIARAFALGLISGTVEAPGVVPTGTPDRTPAPAKVPAASRRRGRPPKAKLAKGQTVLPLRPSGPKLETTEDGVITEPRAARKLKALLPRNVDHDGVPIEDPEVLDRIAEDTAAMEAARAEAEAEDG